MTLFNVSISTHCLNTLPLAEALEKLTPHTSAVEVMNDGLHYTHDVSLLAAFPYEYTIHAPARSVNIASVLEPIRRASVELIAESISLAAECGAKRVVFHPGYFTFKEEYGKAVSALKKSLVEIHAVSEETGIPCCVENMGNWGYFFLQKAEDISLVSGTDFCLDIGHAHECGTLSEFLKVPFVQIHVHDNDGTSDTHLALGKGTIDIAAVAEAVRRNKIVSPIAECATLDDALATKRILENVL
ncbi:MAG TPA: sugar phosphate isomerase/epimerase [Methanocorpusculum sp.]|nr:sugar phosphate isomerase/epimerase [Methanocorpusculum sp.]